MPHLWVRSEQRANEERVGLTPEGAALCKTAVKTLARFTETIVFLLIGTGFWLYTLGSVERGPANATAAQPTPTPRWAHCAPCPFYIVHWTSLPKAHGVGRIDVRPRILRRL